MLPERRILLVSAFLIAACGGSLSPFTRHTAARLILLGMPYAGAVIALRCYVQALLAVGKRKRVAADKAPQSPRTATSRVKEEISARFVAPLRRARKARDAMISLIALGSAGAVVCLIGKWFF